MTHSSSDDTGVPYHSIQLNNVRSGYYTPLWVYYTLLLFSSPAVKRRMIM